MGYGPIEPKFELGRTVATSGVVDLELEISSLIHRHHCGDWGSLCNADKQANDDALITGDRLISKYPATNPRGEIHVVYIITEWDRSVTTVMLPSEY